MTPSQHPHRTARISARRRNFVAVLISLAALCLLSVNFEPTPVGADPSAIRVDVAKLSRTALIPPEPTPQNSGQASYADQTANPQTNPQSSASPSESRVALLLNLLLLENGCSRLEKRSEYTATFFKQECVDGTTETQVIDMKLRHQPFSVYMKWLVGDKGRELLYVDGQNNGKLLVKLGGLKGRFLPCLKLDPNGSVAMQESRHPITKAGLLNMARESISYRQREIVKPKLEVRCRMIDNQTFHERPCYCFILNFNTPEVAEPYRKTIQYIDKELSLPVCVKNYGWPSDDAADSPNLDEETLIEHFSYTNIHFNQQPADLDFDRRNKNYSLRR